jgi:hypothetical protein
MDVCVLQRPLSSVYCAVPFLLNTSTLFNFRNLAVEMLPIQLAAILLACVPYTNAFLKRHGHGQPQQRHHRLADAADHFPQEAFADDMILQARATPTPHAQDEDYYARLSRLQVNGRAAAKKRKDHVKRAANSPVYSSSSTLSSTTSAPTSSSQTSSSWAPSSSSTCRCTNPVAQWGQCGGIDWTGSTCCQSGNSCQYNNDWYWQASCSAAS